MEMFYFCSQFFMFCLTFNASNDILIMFGLTIILFYIWKMNYGFLNFQSVSIQICGQWLHQMDVSTPSGAKISIPVQRYMNRSSEVAFESIFDSVHLKPNI